MIEGTRNVRKKRALITKEDRKLVYHSSFINKYPKIKEILEVDRAIYLKDIDYLKTSEPDTYNQLVYTFKEIKDECSKEWYRYGQNSEGRTNCSLCGTLNKYIYYIRNSQNNTTLNVGSDCFEKFEYINDNHNGESVRQNKANMIKQSQKINRKKEFNSKYPNVEDMFMQWKDDYENLEIIMPYLIDSEFYELSTNSKNFYSKYLNGKIPKKELSCFEDYIKKYNILTTKQADFINCNKNNFFTCSRTIKIWLESIGYNNIIKRIQRDGGLITAHTAKFIHCSEFVRRFVELIRVQFKKFNFMLTEDITDVIIFNYNYKGYQEFKFEVSLKDFMDKFSFLLFEQEALTLDYIISNLKIRWNEKEKERFIDVINPILKKSNYHLSFNREDLELKRRIGKVSEFSILNAEKFIGLHMRILFINKEDAFSLLNDTFSKVSTWKNISEKKKYNVKDLEHLMKTYNR